MPPKWRCDTQIPSLPDGCAVPRTKIVPHLYFTQIAFGVNAALVTTLLPGEYGTSAGENGQTCTGHPGGPHEMLLSETV